MCGIAGYSLDADSTVEIARVPTTVGGVVRIAAREVALYLGPEGGDEGGRVVAAGTPEQLVAQASVSYTGRFLAHALRD